MSSGINVRELVSGENNRHISGWAATLNRADRKQLCDLFLDGQSALLHDKSSAAEAKKSPKLPVKSSKTCKRRSAAGKRFRGKPSGLTGCDENDNGMDAKRDSVHQHSSVAQLLQPNSSSSFPSPPQTAYLGMAKSTWGSFREPAADLEQVMIGAYGDVIARNRIPDVSHWMALAPDDQKKGFLRLVASFAGHVDIMHPCLTEYRTSFVPNVSGQQYPQPRRSKAAPSISREVHPKKETQPSTTPTTSSKQPTASVRDPVRAASGSTLLSSQVQSKNDTWMQAPWLGDDSRGPARRSRKMGSKSSPNNSISMPKGIAVGTLNRTHSPSTRRDTHAQDVMTSRPREDSKRKRDLSVMATGEGLKHNQRTSERTKGKATSQIQAQEGGAHNMGVKRKPWETQAARPPWESERQRHFISQVPLKWMAGSMASSENRSQYIDPAVRQEQLTASVRAIMVEDAVRAANKGRLNRMGRTRDVLLDHTPTLQPELGVLLPSGNRSAQTCSAGRCVPQKNTNAPISISVPSDYDSAAGASNDVGRKSGRMPCTSLYRTTYATSFSRSP